MRKTFFVAIAVSAVLFSAFPALAQEAAGEHGFFAEWGWKIINFGLLVAILVYFMKNPMRQFLKGRTDAIQKSLEESQKAREAAEQALREVEERLRLKDQEMAQIVAASRASGEAERQALIEEAEKMSRKILEQTRSNIDYELKKARDAIREEAVELAIGLAEKKLKERLTPEDEKKLLEDSIARLEAKKG